MLLQDLITSLRRLSPKTLRFWVYLLGLLLLFTIVAKPYKNGPPIRSDGEGYHIWLAAFKTADFNFCRFKKELAPSYSISYINKEKGVCGIKYPPGVALFQAPFTIMSPIPAKKNRLFSDYSHYMILLLGAALLMATLWLTYQTLLLYGPISNGIVVPTFFAGVFGTGLFHYATYDASFSHIYSAFGVSALLYLATLFRKKPQSFTSKHLAYWSGLCFWLYLVRQTNLFPIVIICLYAVLPKLFVKRNLIFAASGALGAIAALGLLLLYNYYVTDTLVVSSYGEERFYSVGKFANKVLFSYNRGVFLYYPFIGFAVGTAVLMLRRDLRLTSAFLALITTYVLMYGSWHSWYLGGGMGHRGFVEAVPVAIAVVALGLKRLQQPWLRRIALVAIVASCYITISILVSYWEGRYPFGGGTKALYLMTLFPPP